MVRARQDSPARLRRLGIGGVLLAASLVAVAAPPQPATPSKRLDSEPYDAVRRLASEHRTERRQAAEELIAAGNTHLVPPVVDMLFFVPPASRAEARKVLERLTGERAGDRYLDWVEVLGRRPDLVPDAGYPAFKRELLERLDPQYRKVFYPGAPLRIRLEEVVWGGVPLDGIPVLEQPAAVPAAEARGLREDETVFGVSLGGEQRAYPLRILSWHEMANDVLGGEPITLSYCTLCGSGVLYGTRTSGEPYTFGTSGLLYRSNKLMFDRQTYSLWSNLTGEPVIGRRARGDVRLPLLPMTRTRWGDWRRRFPATTVVLPDPELGRRYGFDYRPGAADARRRGVRFPAGPESSALERQQEVYGLRLGGQAKAYPLDALLAAGVVHDVFAGRSLVLVADAASGAVRAYDCGERRFRRGATPEQLLDEQGAAWEVEEDALTPAAEGAAPLPRIPGHIAFWFGWYAFFPHTAVYTPAP